MEHMAAKVGSVVRSVEQPGVRMLVHWCLGGLEVTLVEIAAGKSVSDASLYGRPSWHLVLDGQASFRVGDRSWDLLPEESFSLDHPGAFAITNPAPDRLRLLSIVARAGDPAAAAAGGAA
jgi:mannose-6-phosphate isomerase-like protein (cupin superfamily)